MRFQFTSRGNGHVEGSASTGAEQYKPGRLMFALEAVDSGQSGEVQVILMLCKATCGNLSLASMSKVDLMITEADKCAFHFSKYV